MLNTDFSTEINIFLIHKVIKNNFGSIRIISIFVNTLKKIELMENYTFTPTQLSQFMELTNGLSDYQGSSDSSPIYDEILKEIFGENWGDLIGEWDDLFNYEFGPEAYYYVLTGNKPTGFDDWIEQGKEILEQIQEELEEFQKELVG
jgi:hypothetical protein